MDGRTLTRLRVAFVALGVALLLPLVLLVRSASARLEEQRKLKHEVVAERIFDEMERELVALLERERARPSEAYGATNTRPQTWAPFVVGYFTCSPAGPQVTARQLLREERSKRVEDAARSAWRTWRPPGAAAAPVLNPYRAGSEAGPDIPLNPYRSADKASSASNVAQPVPERPAPPQAPSAAMAPAAKQEAVLRQLNRSSQAKSKGKPAANQDLLLNPYGKRSGSGDDPLSGLDDL